MSGSSERNSYKTIFARRVKIARQEKGWNKTELAFHAGLTYATLNAIEAGQSKNGSGKTLIGLSKALGKSIDWLLGLEQEDLA